MHRPLPGVARVVLNWGQRPHDLDLTVQFKNIKYSGEAVFEPASLFGSLCEYGDVLMGSGVYWGCRSQQINEIDADGNSFFASGVEYVRDSTDGFGPEMLLFNNVPDGEYHITVKVYPTVGVDERDGLGDELLIGAEEVRVYLPDGSSKQIYTSVRASQAGMFWHVGFIRVVQAQMSFVTLNYDQLSKDPQTFKAGWLLSMHLQVFSSKSNAPLSQVTYMCYSAGKLANTGTLLSKGNLPATTFEVENQIAAELAEFGTVHGEASTLTMKDLLKSDFQFPEHQYRIVLSKAGYSDKQVILTLSGRKFNIDQLAYLAPLDDKTYVVLNWESNKDLDLWLFPCTNTGKWDVEKRDTRCREGEALEQVYMYVYICLYICL